MGLSFTIIAVINVIITAVVASQWYRGINKVPILREIGEEYISDKGPLLSVIIAACNEEKIIEQSIMTITKQEYKNFEIIVVNDRSTDRTGEILEELKLRCGKLHVIHINQLPKGWLGKNHALYQGATRAKGDWLLFTDADVMFHPNCFKNALSYAVKNKIDHLALFPEMVKVSLPFKIYHCFWFISAMYLFTVSKHVGVGAFNLLKKSIYFKIGTHRKIALRPDDDVKLGKLVVKNGHKQEVCFGKNLVTIQWYENLRGLIKGFEKNTFAFLEYNISVLAVLIVLFLLFGVYPFLAIWTGDFITRVLSALTILILLGMYFYNSRYTNNPFWYVIFHPLNSLLNIYIIVRAVVKTLVNGGIEWRGTNYCLKELRKNSV